MGRKILQDPVRQELSKIRPNDLVRLIGQSLFSVLANCTLGIGVMADCFHIAGNTLACKDTLKISVNGSISSKQNSLMILDEISLRCVAFVVFIIYLFIY